MADAVPVNSTEEVQAPEEAPKAKTKKAASASIPSDVLADLKAQVREELKAEEVFKTPKVAVESDTFKVKGGVPLGTHEAVREDY